MPHNATYIPRHCRWSSSATRPLSATGWKHWRSGRSRCTTPTGGPFDAMSSAQIASRRIYTGRVLNLDIDTVRFPNGSSGELEILRHSGASAVLPFLSDPRAADPQILLIKQYRYAAEDFLYEIPAGRLDPGEEPVACA